MECSSDQSMIECYVHGELSELEKRRLESHFQSCQRCSAIRAEIEAMYSLIRKQAKINEQFKKSDKIKIALIEEVQREEHNRKFNIKNVFIYSSAAMLLLLISAILVDWGYAEHQSKPLKTIWVHDGIRSFKTGHFHTPVAYKKMIFAVKAGASEDHVVAVDAYKGNEIWVSEIASAGRIMTDGQKVYTVGRKNYEIYLAALDIKSGKTEWIYKCETGSVDCAVTAPLKAERSILWCTGQEILILDSRTGILENRKKCNKTGMAAKPVIAGDCLYGTIDNNLICMNIRNDSLVWETIVDEDLSTFIQPVIAAFQNEIYIAGKCSNGRAVAGCFDMNTGKMLWKKRDVPAFHVYAANGTAVFRAGSIMAFDNKGNLMWKRSSPGCSPLTVKGNTVFYFDASDMGGLIAIDLKTGKEKSRFNTGNNCSGVMISEDIGLLCTNDGVLKAFFNQGDLTIN